MMQIWTNNWANLGQIRKEPSCSTFCEGITQSAICEGIVLRFHPLEFVDDIIHSTFCEGIIFQFHPQKNQKIKISKFQNSSCFQSRPASDQTSTHDTSDRNSTYTRFSTSDAACLQTHFHPFYCWPQFHSHLIPDTNTQFHRHWY